MQYIILGLLGAASGFISGYTKAFFEFTPGIVFGIIFGLYFFYIYSPGLLKTLVWVGASVASYYIAFKFGESLALASGSGSEVVGSVPYLCAGIVGVLLVGVSFSFLIKRIRFLYIIFLAVWGGVLALSGIGDLPRTFLFVVWQMGIAYALYLATMTNISTETILAQVSTPEVLSSPPVPNTTWVKKLKVVGLIMFLLLVGVFVYKIFAHDNLVVRQVKETTEYLENYYTQHGYYPTRSEFKNSNPSSVVLSNPSYDYNLGTGVFNQTYSLNYRLNKPVEGAPGDAIMDWGYKGQLVTSCHTRNICEQSYELDKNPNGVQWFVKSIADFTAGITLNQGQAISWLDSNILNHRWQFSEKQYVDSAQVSFSYDTSILTELKPIEPVGPWYEKGSYFKATKPGETVFKITVSRSFWDTGYENGTYGGSKYVESYSQEVRIKVINDPSQDLPTQEYR